MGIHGLLSYIQSAVDTENSTTSCHVRVNIVPGSTLLVDANGFMFWILDKEEGLEARLRRVCGGSYTYYDQIIRHEINLLRDHAKLKLVFYFDGQAQHKFKNLTLEKRLSDREQSILTFLQACQRCQLDTLDGRHLPLPPMMNAQLRATLQELDVEVVQCTSEADQEIALRCSREEVTYCYGKDTDFLALRACRYIPMGSLYVDSNGAVATHLYSRDVLAESVGLTEEQFVEWCLLIGNDYTGAYSRSQFLLSGPTPPNNARPDALEQLREFIVQQGVGYRVTARPSCPELQEAIDFSRDLYQLEDLSRYNDTIDSKEGNRANGDISQEDSIAVERLTEVGHLSKAHKDAIDAFLSNEDVRRQVISSHRQSVQNQKAESKSEDPAVSLVALFALLFLLSHKDSLFSELNESHIVSLGSMLESVCKPPAHQVTTLQSNSHINMSLAIKSHVSSPPTSYPSIGDVYAAHYFQEVCKRVSHTLRKDEKLMQVFPGLTKEQPRFMFDGELFAMLLHAQRGVEDADAIKLKETNSASPPAIPTSAVEQALQSTSQTKKEKKKKSSTPAKDPAVSPTRTEPPVKSVDVDLLQSVLKCPVSSITIPASHSAKVMMPTADTTVKTKPAGAKPSSKGSDDTLPIELHRDEILGTIDAHRVTVIHGETGCGKSSRLPVMIMEQLTKNEKPCKMFVSQPRRLAVHGLLNRLRPMLGAKVGMRMGHGIRDDSSETKICLCTTGYLVQLLANSSDYLLSYTHLIIDEVHERSVEGDLLCWLAKQALTKFAHLKLVLMSATMVMGLYQEYFKKFDANIPCVFVGARRFPVQLSFADDIVRSGSVYSSLVRKLASDIVEGTRKAEVSSAVSDTVLKRQYSLVSVLIREVVPRNTAVLVFVKGIGDIIEIFASFENDPKYILCPVHSDIPIEEQMNIFLPITDNKVKVIVATNSAESSLTLPDVDTVICLGTQKALIYDDKHHIVKLTTCWVSKASAIQRAGRTGRCQPGRVFRLYSEDLYKKLRDHEIAEIKRRSMEEVILQLRSMLEMNEDFEGVVPVLQSLIEPPDMSNVKSSFFNLFRMQMISDPDDTGHITNIGKIASALPIDLVFARLIIYGILLGVGAEAIVLAGALTVGSSMFEVPSPIYNTDPDDYNDIVRRVFLGSTVLDSNCYSEPLLCLRIFVIATSMPNIGKRNNWAYKHGIRRNQLKSFISNTHSLCHRVNDMLRSRIQNSNISFTLDKLEDPLHRPEVLNRLRLILAWVGEDNIVFLEKPKELWHDTGKYSFDKVPSISVLESQLPKLFPESLKLDPTIIRRQKIQYDCIWLRKFIVPASHEQLYSCVESFTFAEEFTAFTADHELPVSWIVNERLDGRKQVADVSVVVDKHFLSEVADADKWFGIYNESELHTISTLLTYIIRSNACLHEKTFEEANEEGDIKPSGEFVILYIPNATTSLQRVLTQLREVLQHSISVTIQLQGHAKILSVDLEIDEKELELLFNLRSADSSPSNAVVTPADAAGLSKKAAKRAAKKAEKAKNAGTSGEKGSGLISKQVLSETYYLQLKASEEEALNQIADDDFAEMTPFARAGFLNDAPLGVRLLNAYRTGYRDKVIRMKGHSADSAAAKWPSKTNISKNSTQVGMTGGISAVESVLNRESSSPPKPRRGSYDGDELGEDGKYEFHLHNLPKFPTWKHVTVTYGSQEGSVKTSTVRVNSFNFSAVSCHMNVTRYIDPNEDFLDSYGIEEEFDCDGSLGLNYQYSKRLIKIATETERVFGCVQNAMFVNQSQVKCENVTIFPLGCRWMILAYLCIGRDFERQDDMFRINYSQALEAVESDAKKEKSLSRRQRRLGHLDEDGSADYSDDDDDDDDNDNNDFSDEDNEGVKDEDLYSDELEPMNMYLTYVSDGMKYKVSDYPISEEDREKCQEVDECMRHFMEMKLQPREELINLVDDLFTAWYDDTLENMTGELEGAPYAELGDGKDDVAVEEESFPIDSMHEMTRGVINLRLDQAESTNGVSDKLPTTGATAAKSVTVQSSPNRRSRTQSTEIQSADYDSITDFDEPNVTGSLLKKESTGVVSEMASLRDALGMTSNKKPSKSEKKKASKLKKEAETEVAKVAPVSDPPKPAKTMLSRPAKDVEKVIPAPSVPTAVMTSHVPAKPAVTPSRVVGDPVSAVRPPTINPAKFIQPASQFKSPPYTCPLCNFHFEESGWVKCLQHTEKCFNSLSKKKVELRTFLESIQWRPLPWDCCWTESQADDAVDIDGNPVNPLALGAKRERVPLAPICGMCHAVVGSRGGFYAHVVQHHSQPFAVAETQFCSAYPTARWPCALCARVYFFQTELADHLESTHHLIPHQIYALLEQSAWSDFDA